ncbi:MAG: arsenic efflux protein [Candidatus Cloacimonetes bacterium]|nr:arsenic efflux protein [Candidatus Cloacimonadota bacterium]
MNDLHHHNHLHDAHNHLQHTSEASNQIFSPALEILEHSIIIALMVLFMMLLVEYLHVRSKGHLEGVFKGSKWKQYILCALLGATPGCFGTFIVVTFYSHGLIGLGALVTTAIVTSGDEAYVFFARAPELAFQMTLGLFFLSIFVGWLTDLLLGSDQNSDPCHLELHHGEESWKFFDKSRIKTDWSKEFFLRFSLLAVLIAFCYLQIEGVLGHESSVFAKVFLGLILVFGSIIIIESPSHFLQEHFLKHIVKAHLPRIFLWTIAAFSIIHLTFEWQYLQELITKHPMVVLFVSGLLGMVPESGPHLIFLTLFLENKVGFSIILTSSIVQDGHGLIPLLAHSRSDFLKVKLINLLVGLFFGGIFYLMYEV